ncbi:MAG TPA: SurA N-terminal domain-containing protein [Rhizomicrobium sp.]|nr:SurA N-terminal domain-containing protein [Rhizomicrobium sp.]
MRKLSKSWVSTVLMGGLALSFALWGIGDIFRGSVSTDVGAVGGTKIEQTQFQREYRNTMRVLGQRMGKDVTTDEARKLDLPRKTLDRMLDEQAVANFTDGLGLKVGDDTVTREIQSMPAFQGVTGTFDHDVFIQRIGQIGFGEKEFIEIMRRDLARAQVKTAIENGMTAPPGYVAALMAYINEARVAQYVVVTPASAGAIAPPSDKVLTDYIAAHPGSFSTPEYRSVTLAAIGPEDVAAKVTVTDKQLHDAYDTNKSKYVVPETRETDQVSFPNEADARAARAKIDGGMSFDALAASRKLSAKAISMGAVSRESLTDTAQGDAIFSLTENGVSQPVKGPFGWVLYRVRKINAPINKTFDDVKAELDKQVRDEVAQSSLVDVINKFTDAEGGGEDTAQAGKSVGMRIDQMAEVDAQGLAPDGSKTVLAGNPVLLKAVFAADVGVDGDPMQVANDQHWYAIKVGGVTAPKLKSLSVVRDRALAAWTRDMQIKALQKQANALAAQANKDGHLTGAVQTSGRLERGAKSGVLSEKIIQTLFTKPVGVAVVGPIAIGEGFVVARTIAVSHPKTLPSANDFKQIGRALSQQIASDFTDALGTAEKNRQGSSVNQKQLDQAVGAENT